MAMTYFVILESYRMSTDYDGRVKSVPTTQPVMTGQEVFFEMGTGGYVKVFVNSTIGGTLNDPRVKIVDTKS